MCFSANVSLFTFIIGIIGAILCISLGETMDIVFGLFLGFVSLMQFIEYLLWNHQVRNNYNRLLSIIGMILNHSQPIVLGIILLLVSKYNDYNKYVILTIIIIYLLFAIVYSIFFLKNMNNQYTIKNKRTKHLDWKWNEEKYGVFFYGIFLLSFVLLFIYGMPTLKQGIYLAFFTVFLYLTTLLFYFSKHLGSMWCFYSAFVPIIYYIIRCTYLKNIDF
jgi:hypothetical protein